MARVNIPSNKDKMIQLSKSILDKHVELGDASPLKGLKVTEWTANTTTADTENKKAAKLRKDAETATQNCDNAIGEDICPELGQYLTAANNGRYSEADMLAKQITVSLSRLVDRFPQDSDKISIEVGQPLADELKLQSNRLSVIGWIKQFPSTNQGEKE